MLAAISNGDIAPVNTLKLATERAGSDSPYRVVSFAARSRILMAILRDNPELCPAEDDIQVASRCMQLILPADAQTFHVLSAAHSVIPKTLSPESIAMALRASEGLGLDFGRVSSKPSHPELGDMSHDAFVIEQLRANPDQYLEFADQAVVFNGRGHELLEFGRNKELGAGCPMIGERVDRKYPDFGRNMYRLFWRGFTEQYIAECVHPQLEK